jgi:hypothetical protein
MEVKKSGLTLYVRPTKLVGDASVSMSFPTLVDGCTLNKLVNNGSSCLSECYPTGSEYSAVCFALYLMVNQQLVGDPLAVSKSKVNSVVCGVNNGHFFINWNVKGTVSAVRKSIGLALKVLNPGKIFSLYSRLVKMLGGQVNKDEFAYVAAEVAKSAKVDLLVTVVGNVKATKEKLEKMLTVLSNKHNVSNVDGTKTKPATHIACSHVDFVELKVSGWQAVAAAEFLKSKIRGLTITVCDKYLLLPMKQSNYDTQVKKLKGYVSDYVKLKYGKLKDDAGDVFAYMGSSSGMMGAYDVRTAINNKLSTPTVIAAINKVL